MLTHSTGNNYYYTPILSLPHLLLVVYSTGYPYSSTKQTHFLKNRTVRMVGALPSEWTLAFYNQQLFPSGLHHSFCPSTLRALPKSPPFTRTPGLPQQVLQTLLMLLLRVSKIYILLTCVASSPKFPLHVPCILPDWNSPWFPKQRLHISPHHPHHLH